MAVGGWLLRGDAAFWVSLTAGVVLTGLVVLLLLTGDWWPLAVWGAFGVGLLGLGGLALPVAPGTYGAGRNVLHS